MTNLPYCAPPKPPAVHLLLQLSASSAALRYDTLKTSCTDHQMINLTRNVSINTNPCFFFSLLHLWFSAGHLALQSLRCVSYSTDRILRLGQSAANHDCRSDKPIRTRGKAVHDTRSRNTVFPRCSAYLRPALGVILMDSCRFFMLCQIAVFLSPCFESSSQKAMHEQNVRLDGLAGVRAAEEQNANQLLRKQRSC